MSKNPKMANLGGLCQDDLSTDDLQPQSVALDALLLEAAGWSLGHWWIYLDALGQGQRQTLVARQRTLCKCQQSVCMSVFILSYNEQHDWHILRLVFFIVWGCMKHCKTNNESDEVRSYSEWVWKELALWSFGPLALLAPWSLGHLGPLVPWPFGPLAHATWHFRHFRPVGPMAHWFLVPRDLDFYHGKYVNLNIMSESN